MTRRSGDSPPEGAGLLPLQNTATIDYRNEVFRKAIHLTSLGIPIIYHFISRTFALWLLVPMTATFIAVDVARYYSQPVSAWFYRWFGWLLRQHEQDGAKKRLNGATHVLISACICVLIFPKVITLTAFAILIVSDTTSALIGRKYGRRPFFKKSLEGSLAFFVSAVLVVFLSPKIQYLPAEYFIGVAAALVGMFTESLSDVIDDNLTIPIAIGAVMWGLYALFLPAVNLYQMT